MERAARNPGLALARAPMLATRTFVGYREAAAAAVDQSKAAGPQSLQPPSIQSMIF